MFFIVNIRDLLRCFFRGNTIKLALFHKSPFSYLDIQIGLQGEI